MSFEQVASTNETVRMWLPVDERDYNAGNGLTLHNRARDGSRDSDQFHGVGQIKGRLHAQAWDGYTTRPSVHIRDVDLAGNPLLYPYSPVRRVLGNPCEPADSCFYAGLTRFEGTLPASGMEIGTENTLVKIITSLGDFYWSTAGETPFKIVPFDVQVHYWGSAIFIEVARPYPFLRVVHSIIEYDEDFNEVSVDAKDIRVRMTGRVGACEGRECILPLMRDGGGDHGSTIAFQVKDPDPGEFWELFASMFAQMPFGRSPKFADKDELTDQARIRFAKWRNGEKDIGPEWYETQAVHSGEALGSVQDQPDPDPPAPAAPGPEVDFLIPQFVRASVVIEPVVTDNGTGIDSVRLLVGGVQRAATATPPYNLSWDTSLDPDGPVQVVVEVSGGGAIDSRQRPTRVDNTAPTVVLDPISEPASGIVGVVCSSASDAQGLDTVEFLLAGQVVFTTGPPETAPYNWSWDTTAQPDGNYVVALRARDKAGNATIVNQLVTVDNSAAPEWDDSTDIEFTEGVSGSHSWVADITDFSRVTHRVVVSRDWINTAKVRGIRLSDFGITDDAPNDELDYDGRSGLFDHLVDFVVEEGE